MNKKDTFGSGNSRADDLVLKFQAGFKQPAKNNPGVRELQTKASDLELVKDLIRQNFPQYLGDYLRTHKSDLETQESILKVLSAMAFHLEFIHYFVIDGGFLQYCMDNLISYKIFIDTQTTDFLLPNKIDNDFEIPREKLNLFRLCLEVLSKSIKNPKVAMFFADHSIKFMETIIRLLRQSLRPEGLEALVGDTTIKEFCFTFLANAFENKKLVGSFLKNEKAANMFFNDIAENVSESRDLVSLFTIIKKLTYQPMELLVFNAYKSYLFIDFILTPINSLVTTAILSGNPEYRNLAISDLPAAAAEITETFYYLTLNPNQCVRLKELVADNPPDLLLRFLLFLVQLGSCDEGVILMSLSLHALLDHSRYELPTYSNDILLECISSLCSGNKDEMILILLLRLCKFCLSFTNVERAKIIQMLGSRVFKRVPNTDKSSLLNNSVNRTSLAVDVMLFDNEGFAVVPKHPQATVKGGKPTVNRKYNEKFRTEVQDDGEEAIILSLSPKHPGNNNITATFVDNTTVVNITNPANNKPVHTNHDEKPIFNFMNPKSKSFYPFKTSTGENFLFCKHSENSCSSCYMKERLITLTANDMILLYIQNFNPSLLRNLKQTKELPAGPKDQRPDELYYATIQLFCEFGMTKDRQTIADFLLPYFFSGLTAGVAINSYDVKMVDDTKFPLLLLLNVLITAKPEILPELIKTNIILYLINEAGAFLIKFGLPSFGGPKTDDMASQIMENVSRRPRKNQSMHGGDKVKVKRYEWKEEQRKFYEIEVSVEEEMVNSTLVDYPIEDGKLSNYFWKLHFLYHSMETTHNLIRRIPNVFIDAVGSDLDRLIIQFFELSLFPQQYQYAMLPVEPFHEDTECWQDVQYLLKEIAGTACEIIASLASDHSWSFNRICSLLERYSGPGELLLNFISLLGTLPSLKATNALLTTLYVYFREICNKRIMQSNSAAYQTAVITFLRGLGTEIPKILEPAQLILDQAKKQPEKISVRVVQNVQKLVIVLYSIYPLLLELRNPDIINELGREIKDFVSLSEIIWEISAAAINSATKLTKEEIKQLKENSRQMNVCLWRFLLAFSWEMPMLSIRILQTKMANESYSKVDVLKDEQLIYLVIDTFRIVLKRDEFILPLKFIASDFYEKMKSMLCQFQSSMIWLLPLLKLVQEVIQRSPDETELFLPAQKNIMKFIESNQWLIQQKEREREANFKHNLDRVNMSKISNREDVRFQEPSFSNVKEMESIFGPMRDNTLYNRNVSGIQSQLAAGLHNRQKEGNEHQRREEQIISEAYRVLALFDRYIELRKNTQGYEMKYNVISREPKIRGAGLVSNKTIDQVLGRDPNVNQLVEPSRVKQIPLTTKNGKGNQGERQLEAIEELSRSSFRSLQDSQASLKELWDPLVKQNEFILGGTRQEKEITPYHQQKVIPTPQNISRQDPKRSALLNAGQKLAYNLDEEYKKLMRLELNQHLSKHSH